MRRDVERRSGSRGAGGLRAAVAAAAFFLSLCLLAPMPGCGGGGDGVISAITAIFFPSGSQAAADFVRMTPGSASSALVTVIVSIGGPTTSGDIYSFAFDVVIGDPTVASYVANSASAGTALKPGSGQGVSVLASQEGDRVVVGVTKTGGGPGTGNGVAAGEESVVSLMFQVKDRATTTVAFEGSPSNPQNPTSDPAALDSTGAVIPSIVFDSSPARLRGQ